MNTHYSNYVLICTIHFNLELHVSSSPEYYYSANISIFNLHEYFV